MMLLGELSFFWPIYRSKNENVPRDRIVDLLFYRKHCSLTKNCILSYQQKMEEKVRNCLNTFSTEDVLEKNQELY